MSDGNGPEFETPTWGPLQVYVTATETYFYDDDPTPQTRAAIPPGVSGNAVYRGDECLLFTEATLSAFQRQILTVDELNAVAEAWGYEHEYLRYQAGW